MGLNPPTIWLAAVESTRARGHEARQSPADHVLALWIRSAHTHRQFSYVAVAAPSSKCVALAVSRRLPPAAARVRTGDLWWTARWPFPR
jgi:hypothetical protein